MQLRQITTFNALIIKGIACTISKTKSKNIFVVFKVQDIKKGNDNLVLKDLQ
jgi:hypothetical protein